MNDDDKRFGSRIYANATEKDPFGVTFEEPAEEDPVAKPNVVTHKQPIAEPTVQSPVKKTFAIRSIDKPVVKQPEVHAPVIPVAVKSAVKLVVDKVITKPPVVKPVSKPPVVVDQEELAPPVDLLPEETTSSEDENPVPSPEIQAVFYDTGKLTQVENTTMAPPPKNNKPKLKMLIIPSVVFIVLLGGGVFAYFALQNKPTTPIVVNTPVITKPVAPKCTPNETAKLDQTVAAKTYKTFAQAIKDGDQTCVDALSSSYFKEQQAIAFPDAKGKWVASKPGGLKSLQEKLAQLPANLVDTTFTQTDYIQAIPEGLNYKTSQVVNGITLAYPLSEGTTKYQLTISFVLQSGKVLVDDFLLSADTTDGKISTPDTPGELNPAAKTLTEANVRYLSAHLEAYFATVNYYPGDINDLKTTAGFDQTTLTQPTGVILSYAATPTGCTTVAHTCLHFTLTATVDSDDSTIISKSSLY